MTEAAQHTCPQCGRGRWAGDRYCAGCGLDLDLEGATRPGPASALYDIDALGDDTSVTASEETSGRASRESMLGLAVLVLLLGGFVAVLASGGGDSQAVELPTPEPSVEPTAPPDPTPSTVVPTALPTAIEQAPSTTSSIASAEAHDAGSPPAGQAVVLDEREQLLDRGSQLWTAVEPLGLDGGFVVALDQGRVVAIDLDTGLANYSPAPPVQEFLGAYVTVYGLFTHQLSAGRTIWSQWAWDSSGRRAFTAEFDTVAVFDDPTVGPVVVSAGQPPSGDLFFTATAMLSGAERPIEVADPAELLWPRLAATRSGLQVPDAGFYADDGTTVYSWTWADGWIEHAKGQLAFNDQHGVVIFDCAGPTECPTRVFASDGSAGSEFALSEIRSRLLVSSMQLVSPDRSQIAILESDVRPAMERPRIDLLSAATGEKLRIGTTDFNWWKIHSWTPDGRYVIATGEAGLAAIDVATGDAILLDTSPDSEFGGVTFLPELR